MSQVFFLPGHSDSLTLYTLKSDKHKHDINNETSNWLINLKIN